jgi:hypothetical protein
MSLWVQSARGILSSSSTRLYCDFGSYVPIFVGVDRFLSTFIVILIVV